MNTIINGNAASNTIVKTAMYVKKSLNKLV